jgi:hypothetical protein
MDPTYTHSFLNVFFYLAAQFASCGFEADQCGWASSKDPEERDWWVRGSTNQFAQEGAQSPPTDHQNDAAGQTLVVTLRTLMNLTMIKIPMTFITLMTRMTFMILITLMPSYPW